MTLLFYKVGDFFTSNYTEAKAYSNKHSIQYIPYYLEDIHNDYLENFIKYDINQAIDNYKLGNAKLF